MKLKNKRHQKILELIKDHNIDTQESLTEYLSASGIKATQATVSRDIRELHLVKVLADGGYRYEQRQANAADSVLSSSTYNFMKDNIITVRTAQNLVVIKCYPGTADAVCASLDAEEREYIVGSIAGDDTIFLAAEDTAAAEKLRDYIAHIIR